MGLSRASIITLFVASFMLLALWAGATIRYVGRHAVGPIILFAFLCIVAQVVVLVLSSFSRVPPKAELRYRELVSQMHALLGAGEYQADSEGEQEDEAITEQVSSAFFDAREDRKSSRPRSKIAFSVRLAVMAKGHFGRTLKNTEANRMVLSKFFADYCRERRVRYAHSALAIPEAVMLALLPTDGEILVNGMVQTSAARKRVFDAEERMTSWWPFGFVGRAGRNVD
jgi:hypothetical protein